MYQLTNEAVSADSSGETGAVSYGLGPVGNRVSANLTVSGVMSGILSYNLDDQLNSETYDANGNAVTVGSKPVLLRLGEPADLDELWRGHRAVRRQTGVAKRLRLDRPRPLPPFMR